MTGQLGQRVLDVLTTEGPEMPIVVLSRHLGLPPTRLIAILDDLHDAGLVSTGRERGSVTLVRERKPEEGRFARPAPAEKARSRSL